VVEPERRRRPDPLPSANSRRPSCCRRLWEVNCPLASSEHGSPAAVAEGGRCAAETRRPFGC
jgi:hypothetical protein